MNTEQKGTIIILIGLFIYGIHPVVVELGGLFLMPLFFAAIAAILAGLFALPFAVYSSRKEPIYLQRRDYMRLVFAGVFGTFLAFTCLFIGLQLTSSNNAAIILRSELAFALVFGYFFLHETISLRQALWILLMISGVLFVVISMQVLVWSIGDMLLLITPAAWAAGHTFAKPTLEQTTPWVVVVFRNLVGGSLLLLVSLSLILLGALPILVPNILMITGIVIIETIVILLAHTLWYAGIQRINLGKATALIAPAPLVTFVLSILVFNVLPMWWQLLGAVLVISATILLSREVSLRRSSEKKVKK